MTTLLGLIKLLGIAEQYYTPPALRCSKDIGERHLASFVYKENVHRFDGVRARPEPCRAANNIRVAGRQCIDCGLVAVERRNGSLVVIVVVVMIFLCPSYGQANLSARLATASSRLRITLWLPAVTPTFLPCRSIRKSSRHRCRFCLTLAALNSQCPFRPGRP
jgi:hypothetical protein